MGELAVLLVSILIPCWNAEKWIGQAIESALAQTWANTEVIVVDDGSTDRSLAIIRQFSDRIRYESGPNRGGNVARNRLLQLSRGEWLEFLDADDFLRPTKIEKQMALVTSQPELDVIYSPTVEFIPETGEEKIDTIEDEDVYANYFRWTYFSTTSLLLKKAALEEVGCWKNDQPVCQEHELISRLLLAGKKFAMMREALGVNRMQNLNSVSRRNPHAVLPHKLALLDRVEAHLQLSNELTDLRRTALAQARLGMARAVYSWDKHLARSLAARAIATGPLFPPYRFNRLYIHALRFFGFEFAERIASIQRNLFGRILPSEKHG